MDHNDDIEKYWDNYQTILKKIMDDFNLNGLKIEREMGSPSASTVGNILNRKNVKKPKIDHLLKIGEYLKLDIDFANAIYKKREIKEKQIKTEGLFWIPLLYESSVGDLNMTYLKRNAIGLYPTTYRQENVFCLAAETTKMIPKIEPGDRILIDLAQKATNGDLVFILLSSGNKTIGKLNYKDDFIVIHYENAEAEIIEKDKILSISVIAEITKRVLVR